MGEGVGKAPHSQLYSWATGTWSPIKGFVMASGGGASSPRGGSDVARWKCEGGASLEGPSAGDGDRESDGEGVKEECTADWTNGRSGLVDAGNGTDDALDDRMVSSDLSFPW